MDHFYQKDKDKDDWISGYLMGGWEFYRVTMRWLKENDCLCPLCLPTYSYLQEMVNKMTQKSFQDSTDKENLVNKHDKL